MSSDVTRVKFVENVHWRENGGFTVIDEHIEKYVAFYLAGMMGS
jgi:hypothetical protein